MTATSVWRRSRRRSTPRAFHEARAASPKSTRRLTAPPHRCAPTPAFNHLYHYIYHMYQCSDRSLVVAD